MRATDLRRKFIPDYAVLPLILCLIGQMATYYGTRLINMLIHGSVAGYTDLTLEIDRMIPVIPLWSVVYFASYVFWIVSYIAAGRENKGFFCRMMTADAIGKIICFIIFIAMPTTAERPEITGGGFGETLLKYLYSIDLPDNLFPSMHCLISWFSFRFVMKSAKTPQWCKISAFVFAVAVFASVLFTKQHTFVDIISGVAVAELSVQIGFRTNKLYKIYEKLDITGFIERKTEIGSKR